MFIYWHTTSQPQYPSMDPSQSIAYISDVGAYRLKAVFIAGCALTTVFLDLSILAERYLRHTGRLARNTSRTQKILSNISIFFAVAGSAGLILLAVFDTYRHRDLHNVFLLLFLAGFLLSAIATCVEYQRLGIHYRNHRILRISFWTKLTFIIVEVLLAGAFAGTSFTRNRDIGAVLEWVVAFVFTGYIVTFLLDLLPSVRTKTHVPQGSRVEMGEGGSGELVQDLTQDSQGPGRVEGRYRADGYENGVNGYTNQQGRKAGWANRWRNF